MSHPLKSRCFYPFWQPSASRHLLALGLILLIGSASAEPVQLSNSTPLKPRQDQALDADGKPIQLREFTPALEYNAKEAQVVPISAGKQARRHSNTRSSRQRNAIADDASCRWLNNRMGELRKRLQSGSRLSDYINDEMHQYQRQWQCLDCSGSGPAAGDHARCGL